MYNNLIETLNNNIKKLNNDIIFFSKRQNNIKNVYDRIYPRNDEIRVNNLITFLDDKKIDKLIKCFKEVRLLEENHILRLIDDRRAYNDYKRSIDQVNKQAGITEEMIFSEAFRKRVMSHSQDNPKLVTVYFQIVENKKELEKKNETLQELLETVSMRIINEYELILEEKKSRKDLLKTSEDILEKLSKEKNLNPVELSLITSYIEEVNDEDLRKKLVEELKTFNNKTFSDTKKEIIKQENKPVKTFFDDDIEQVKEERDSSFINHLNSLRCFTSKEEIIEYLDSLKYLNNIKIFISKMVSNLSEDEDFLREVLVDYATDLDVIKEEVNTKEENKIFYHGVTTNKNIILNDLKSIPEEYFKDVYKGLLKIKDNKINNAKYFQRLRKIQKIRENKIRITFKRIADSTYVLLGVYCKKDNKGNDIVESTVSRSEDLKFEEQAIKDAYALKLYTELLENNDIMEEEIFNKLLVKIK